MIKDVLQCCYTNATTSKGDTMVSGWSIVAESEGIPSEALEGCTRFQKGNSNMRQGIATETGDDLSLLEIVGDGAYLYVMRSQFGLKDVRGRRNMFSHAYILPWDEGMLHEPNSFLAISDANFCTNEADALVMHDAFQYDDELDVEKALELAHIDGDEKLASLVCAVYEQMTNASVLSSLYVRCEGGARQMRAFLYCLYTFLPVHIRRRLVSASAEGSNAPSTNIIFCDKVPSRGTCFDVDGNVGNAITPSRRAAIKRLGFVDYAVRNRKRIDVQAYFDELERTAQGLNLASSSDVQVARAYRIAHMMLVRKDVREYTDSELDRFFDESLRLASHDSELLDGFLAEMLDEIRERSLELSDDTEKDLRYKLQEPHSAKLDAAEERYTLHTFEKLPPESAAKKLADMGEETFDKYASFLKGTKKGQEILDTYFADYVLDAQDPTWEMLDEVLASSSIVANRQRTAKAVADAAWELYMASVEDLDVVVESLNSYLHVMQQLTNKEDLQLCNRRARAEFWNRVDEENLSREYQDVYEKMNDHSERAQSAIEVLRNYQYLVPGSEEKFLVWVYKSMRKHAAAASRAERRAMLDGYKRMVEDGYAGTDPYLARWLECIDLASAEGNDEWLKILLELRCALIENDREKLLHKLLDEMVDLKDLSGDRRSATMVFLERTCSLVKDYLYDIDERAMSDGGLFSDLVPVDIWLKIGYIFSGNNGRGGGPFRVFNDQRKPGILYKDIREVVSSSKLLHKPFYKTCAYLYMEARGSEAPTVRYWLREVEARERADERARRKAWKQGGVTKDAEASLEDVGQDGGFFGAFGRLFSRGPKGNRGR